MHPASSRKHTAARGARSRALDNDLRVLRVVLRVARVRRYGSNADLDRSDQGSDRLTTADSTKTAMRVNPLLRVVQPATGMVPADLRRDAGAAASRQHGAPLVFLACLPGRPADARPRATPMSARWHTGSVANVDTELIVANVSDWSRWLDEHEADSAGVWLVLAKKGTTRPTSLTYDEALEAAIRHGWVDGQLSKRDERTYRRKFTPRRRGSVWSKRNVAIATRLTDEDRMEPAGLAAVERAKADGSWDSAYEGQATITVPPDLAASLAATPAAKAMFDRLDAGNRYAVLYRVSVAKRAETRQRRIEQLVSMLASGETIHPQRQRRR